MKISSHQGFVKGDIGACILMGVILITSLGPVDRTKVNITSIVGTLATVGGIAFAIREQYNLKKTSDIIQQNTELLKNRAIKKSLEFHFNHCLKYAGEIQDLIIQNAFQPVNLRLCDLRDCLIECKKVIHLNQDLDEGDVESITKQVDLFITNVSAYISRLRISGFEPGKRFNKTKFIEDITKIHGFIDEKRESQSNFVH